MGDRHLKFHELWDNLCGGHLYAYCRKDNGGCGSTTYDPTIQDDTCLRVGFGYEGTA